MATVHTNPKNIVVGSTAGPFSTTASSLTPATGLNVTIVTTGSPVRVTLQPTSSGGSLSTGYSVLSGQNQSSQGNIAIYRDGANVYETSWQGSHGNPTGSTYVASVNVPACLDFVDDPAPSAGSHTYQIYISVFGPSGATAVTPTAMLVAEELKDG